MTRKSKFPSRLKQDGSKDTMCLACFETFSPVPVEASSPNTVDQDLQDDHICAFAFPDRRANQVTFEDGPKRRQSDMDWNALIGREAMLSAE